MTDEAPVIKSAASQIDNLQKALHNEVIIELICHGQSLPFVLNERGDWTAIITHLLTNGVEIVACENMLSANGKLKSDVFPGIKTVPAAIAEIVIRQHQGWSYVKAGF